LIVLVSRSVEYNLLCVVSSKKLYCDIYVLTPNISICAKDQKLWVRRSPMQRIVVEIFIEIQEDSTSCSKSLRGGQHKSSAIAEIARVFLVNSHHGHDRNPIVDANTADFYRYTTLWCPSLNPVVGRYGTQP